MVPASVITACSKFKKIPAKKQPLSISLRFIPLKVWMKTNYEMSSKYKMIFFFIVVLVLLGGAFGYYLFNKGPLDVRSSSATKISATTLYQQLSTDSVSALTKYAGKILEVSGRVSSVTSNQKKEQVILLESGSGNAYVNCSMEEIITNAEASSTVTIKGICSGIGEGDIDLGISGDVYLTRCILIK